MIQSCVTISLVEQARGGPFVFWDNLEPSIARAAELGFDAVELFLPSPDAVQPDTLTSLLESHGLRLAAVGTGAGWVIHGLSLTDEDDARRARACDFVRQMIDFGGQFGAPAIIGSMQGRAGGATQKAASLERLGQSLDQLGEHAAQHQSRLIYEPLNRYETDLVNTLADGATLLSSLRTSNVRLLADLFHMNIEEVDIAAAIRQCGKHIGHIHFVDSNRQAAGRGHIDYAPIVSAIRDIEYDGYLSAEALPIPDSEVAARTTMDAFRKWFGEERH